MREREFRKPPPGFDASWPAQDDAPLTFGTSPAELTPNTLKVIRKNAGKLHATQLAEALCWSMHRLERVAREHGVVLKLEAETEPRGA